jgi:hypothetical protein
MSKKDPTKVDYKQIMQNVTQKVKQSKVKETPGKKELKEALKNLTIKLNAPPIIFSFPKQAKDALFTPISIDINQGVTDFCVGCTISRHFVTILTEILKLEGQTLTLDIGLKLFKLYMFRCTHLRNRENDIFEERDEKDVVPYAYLSLFMNEINQGSFELIFDRFYGHYSISTGHATPIVDKAISHEILNQNNDIEHPLSDTFSVDELSPFIEDITENDIQEIHRILMSCHQILTSNNKKLIIHTMIQGTDKGEVSPSVMLDYLKRNGQNSIITLESAELTNTTDNWDVLEHPPRDANITFSKDRNDDTLFQFGHSVMVYDVADSIIYIKNSYPDNGPSLKSRSGANMSILKYQLTPDSVTFIKDCVKIEIVDLVKAKGITKKRRKTRRKTRKQNKLK